VVLSPETPSPFHPFPPELHHHKVVAAKTVVQVPKEEETVLVPTATTSPAREIFDSILRMIFRCRIVQSFLN